MKRQIFIALTVLLLATVVQAATIIVNTTDDELNTDGDCSLREATRSSNLDLAVDGCESGSGSDRIVLPEGEFRLTIPGEGEDASRTGDLDLTDTVGIEGKGPGRTRIIHPGHTVFHIAPGDRNLFANISELSIINPARPIETNDSGLSCLSTPRALTPRGLDAPSSPALAFLNETGGSLKLVRVFILGLEGDGSVIRSTGALGLDRARLVQNIVSSEPLISALGGVTMYNSLISNNQANNSEAGVRVVGSLIMRDSIVACNTALESGPVDVTGYASIVNSSVVSNRSEAGAGGIRIAGSGEVENTTVSGNSAEGGVGGISASADVTMRHLTVVDNFGQIGGIAGGRVSNSIIFGNSNGNGASDCSIDTSIDRFNVLRRTSGCRQTGNNDVLSPNAPLSEVVGPLVVGGTSPFHNLAENSPARDGISVFECSLSMDQHRTPRPLGGGCDVGAIEAAVPLPPTMVSINARANIVAAGADFLSVPGCGANDPGDFPSVLDIPLGARSVTFTVEGTISTFNRLGDPVFKSPDGQTRQDGPATYLTGNSLSGPRSQQMEFTAGVFLTDSAPSGPAPRSLNIAEQEETLALLPNAQVGQIFYIGDAKTTNGPLKVVIPEEATRLGLGILDSCNGEAGIGAYGDNQGSLDVTLNWSTVE